MRSAEKLKAILSICFCILAHAAATTGVADAIRAEQLTATALDLDADAKRGARLYQAQCAGCHGRDARGDPAQRIPALAAQRRAYVIKSLADFSERDRITTRMHQVVAKRDVREPQAWADLALYLNALSLSGTTQTGDGKYLSLGEASYEQWCVSCHEADARGDDDGFVPSLRNQHFRYLLDEMRALGEGHRFNVEPELGRFLNSLESDEMNGMADYLSRMQGPVDDRVRLNKDGTASD